MARGLLTAMPNVLVGIGTEWRGMDMHPDRRSRRVRIVIAATLVAALEVPRVAAEEGGYAEEGEAEAREPVSTEVEAAEPTFLGSLRDALIGGKVSFNLRVRAEIVDQAGADTAQAYTERLRLGYGTKPFHGLSFYAEFEDIRSADEDLYNAAGQNGEPNKAIVADPEDTELNQAFAKYTNEYITAIAGRQRITLDDHRFVGNVGWRQNEQTFDAYTLSSSWIEDTVISYSFVDDVNRVFGPDANLDFESNSHLVNLSYAGLPIGKITAFSYLLDFRNADASSSDTYGLRLAGSQDLSEELRVGYAASYAYQVDAGSNPNDYNANYYFGELSLARKDLGVVGSGYEVLESDEGDFAFQTPLATLHKFNGWADAFLMTPNGGLQDFYLFLGVALPLDIQSRGIYHFFWTEEGGGDLGEEFDAVVSKAFSKNISVLGKLAVFDGQNGFADRTKYWMQVEFKF